MQHCLTGLFLAGVPSDLRLGIFAATRHHVVVYTMYVVPRVLLFHSRCASPALGNEDLPP